MKVLLCLCTLIAASNAGLIGYPVAPIAYPTYTYTNVLSPPLTTVGRPFVPYTGHPFGFAPSYFSYNVIPNNVFYTGVPGVVHYLPIAPPNGKGKPGEKKPGDKKPGDKDGKETKEETTEEPKKEEAESKTDETEDLA